MQLYLIRHGIAGERAEYATDAERPLTEAGRKKHGVSLSAYSPAICALSLS